MGQIFLGVLLVLWGLTLSLHLPVPAVLLGILAVVTGILVLVGR